MLTSILVRGSQHNRRGRIGVGSDPCTVLNKEDKEEERNTDDDESAIQCSNARGLVLLEKSTEDLEPCGGILDKCLLGNFCDWCLIFLGLLGCHFGAGGAGDGYRIIPGGGYIGVIRCPRVNVGIQHCRKGDGGSDTNTRSESQHQPNHDAGEVGSHEGVDDNKHMLVPEFPEAKDDASREEEHEELEIHKERWPGSRLVLGH